MPQCRIFRYMAKYKNQNLAKITQLGSAVSDAGRVRALMALTGGELCVCQIVELLGLAPSTVSKHMALLRHAGFVQGRKQGRWMYYCLVENLPDSPQAEMLNLLIARLANDTTIEDDRRKLEKIKKIDMEQLCKNQRKS